MKKNKLLFVTLSLILFLGFFVRFYRLDQNIPSLYADESGHYFLRNMVLGNSDSIKSLLYNKIYYGTFSFTWIFGLTPFGVRSASALYRSLTVLACYFFAYSVSKSKVTSLVSAILMAIIPWGYMLSRLGHTHNAIVILLTTTHIALFLKANNLKGYLISFLFLLLGFLYYPSMVVVGPVAALLLYSYAIKAVKKNKRVFATFLIGMAVILSTPFVLDRFQLLDESNRALDLAIWRDVNTPYDTDK